jgi:hypothetical protein
MMNDEFYGIHHSSFIIPHYEDAKLCTFDELCLILGFFFIFFVKKLHFTLKRLNFAARKQSVLNVNWFRSSAG